MLAPAPKENVSDSRFIILERQNPKSALPNDKFVNIYVDQSLNACLAIAPDCITHNEVNQLTAEKLYPELAQAAKCFESWITGFLNNDHPHAKYECSPKVYFELKRNAQAQAAHCWPELQTQSAMFDKLKQQLLETQIPAHITGNKLAIRVGGPARTLALETNEQSRNNSIWQYARRIEAAIDLAQQYARSCSPALEIVLWTSPGWSQDSMKLIDKLHLCDVELGTNIISKSVRFTPAGSVFHASATTGTRYMSRSQVLELLDLVDNQQAFCSRIENMLDLMIPTCKNNQENPQLQFLVLSTKDHVNHEASHKILYVDLMDKYEEVVKFKFNWTNHKSDIIKNIIDLVAYHEFLETDKQAENFYNLSNCSALKEDLLNPKYSAALENLLLDRRPEHYFDLGYSTPLQPVSLGQWQVDEASKTRKFVYSTSNIKYQQIIDKLLKEQPNVAPDIANSDYIGLYLFKKYPTYDQLKLEDALAFGERPDISYLVVWGNIIADDEKLVSQNSIIVREHTYPPEYWLSHYSSIVDQLSNDYKPRTLTRLFSFFKNNQGELLLQLGGQVAPYQEFNIRSEDGTHYYWIRQHVKGVPLDTLPLINYDYNKLNNITKAAIEAIVPSFLAGRRSYYPKELYCDSQTNLVSIGTTGAFCINEESVDDYLQQESQGLGAAVFRLLAFAKYGHATEGDEQGVLLGKLKKTIELAFIGAYESSAKPDEFQPHEVINRYQRIVDFLGPLPDVLDLRPGILFTEQLLQLDQQTVNGFVHSFLKSADSLMLIYESLLFDKDGNKLQISLDQHAKLISVLSAIVMDHYDTPDILGSLQELITGFAPNSSMHLSHFNIDQRIRLLTIANVTTWLQRDSKISIDQLIDAIFRARSRDLFAETLKDKFPNVSLCQQTAELFYDAVKGLKETYDQIEINDTHSRTRLQKAVRDFSFGNIEFA